MQRPLFRRSKHAPWRRPNTRPTLQQAALASLLSLALVPAQAGTFSSNFSDDPGTSIANRPETTTLVRDGVLKLVDLKDLIDPDTGAYNEQRLPLQGSYILPEIDPGQKVASFTATFKARVGGGTENGALGFSLDLANDYPSTGTFREMGGSTTGLTIGFVEVDSRADGFAEGSDPGDAPGIIVKQGGKKVIAKRFAGLRTDPAGDGHAPVFVPVTVQVSADGLLSVSYNGTNVFDKVAIGYIPLQGQFGFGAGIENQTAIVRDNFWIDDLSITTTPVSGSYVTSVEPGTQNAAPDAAVKIGIQDLGATTAQMLFDNTAVTPTKSDAGNGITLLTYRSNGLFDPGSTHTVKVTFGSKTFQYAFTVSNSPLIPPSAAAVAGSVDTGKAGFKVRTYQVDAGQGDNSAARAEKELSGALGPNTADLSSANPDGTFSANVINFSLDGSDAGSIPGDSLIPGIPGNATVDPNGNVAMEVIGFLDLKANTAYTIGAVSDDSIKVTIGAEPRDVTATTLLDIAIGTATGSFIVQQAGIYPIRALWTQGGGAASLELWSQDASGNKVLLNDTATAGGLKSYAARSASYKVPPYISSAKPAPGELNVSTQPKFQLVINDDGTTLDPATVKVTINGTVITVPSASISKTGTQSTISVTLPQALQATTVQQVQVDFADNTARAISRQYSFTTGKGVGGNQLNSVKGYWNFKNGDLSAVVGRDLQYVDPTQAGKYKFGVSGQGQFASVDGINGQPTHFIYVPYLTDPANIWKQIGLRVNHSIAPNGSSDAKKVNQYTAILDIMWGDGSGYGALWQLHDLANGGGDSDMYWQESTGAYGKSCCSSYVAAGKKQTRHQWSRVVFSVDLAANPPILAKYIDGVKNLDQITGNRGHLDSEFALSVPEIVLFGDSDNENSDAYLSAFQIREGRLSDEEVAALGAADANGIPLPYSQWDFNPSNPLSATVGNDLQYVDPSIASKYKAGVTGTGDFASVPGINGQPVNALLVPYLTDPANVWKQLGLRVQHGLAPNGGGAKVNQYTAIMDIMWGDGSAYGAVWQLHDLANGGGDSDMYWQESTGAYGKSCCSAYVAPGQKQARHEWARVVFSVDLSATPPILAKYINGVKNLDQITGNRGHVDSEFALSVPEVVLFGDSDNENSDAYISHLQFRAGRMSDEEVAALGGPSASGIPSPNPVKGEWNFDDAAHPLAATVGSDLQFVDPTQASQYKAGVTGQGDFASVPGINGKPTGLIKVPYLTDPANIWKQIGLRVRHGVPANGGGAKANQYTAIMDLMWGDGSAYGAVWQLHDLANGGGDSDMYWQESTGAYGKSCCSGYVAPGQKQARHEWARVVFAVDLSANPPILAKYINGVKNLDQITGNRGHVDSEFALSIPEIVLFGDSDNENSDAYLSALQIREGRMSDDEVAALGGPDADGIPQAAIGATAAPASGGTPTLAIAQAGSKVTLSWQANITGFTLESNTALGTANWTAVSGVANNSITITVQPATKATFYRLKK